MRIRSISTAAVLLATAGCEVSYTSGQNGMDANIAMMEADLENSITATLSNQGAVQEVDLTPQDANTMTGFAVVRDNSGERIRFNCTARRTGGTDYRWNCQPVIDERVLSQVEGVIRNRLSTQVDVVEVELQRGADDDHMIGHATVRQGSGEPTQIPCTAQRSPQGGFDWRCGADAVPGGGQDAGGQPGNMQ